MAKQGKLKSIAGKILEAEMAAGNIGDEEYDPNSRRKPFEEQVIDHEVKAIDKLLLSIPRGQGFYFKLEKEIRPGLWEYKDRYDDWINWTDVQYQMANIVRSYTAKPGMAARWGSGLYRFLIWKDNGLRDEEQFPPILYYIDAMEPNLNGSQPPIIQSSIDPSQTIQSQISMLSQVLDLVKKGNPTTDDQKQVYEKLADLKVDLAKNESNNQTSVVTSMMTMLQAQMNKPPEQRQSAVQEIAALIIALAPTGIFDKLLKPNIPSTSPSNPVQDLISAFQQIKTLGLIPEPKKEPNFLEQIEHFQRLNQILNPPKPEKDTLDQTVDMITKTKALMGLIEPGTEKISPILRFAEAFAPHVIKLGSETIDYLKTRKNTTQPVVVVTDPNQMPGRTSTSIPMNQPVLESPMDMGGGMFSQADMEAMRRAEEYRDRMVKNAQPQQPQFEQPIQYQPQPQPQQVQQPIIVQEEQMLPVFAEMKRARDLNAIEYYPMLRDLLITQLGDNYDNLLNGQLPIDMVLTQARPYAGAWIMEPMTKAYFLNFVNWANAEKKNEFVAFCEKCEEEIVFPNKAAFDQSTKTCQICGLPLFTDEQPPITINIPSTSTLSSEPQQHQQIDQMPEILNGQ